MDRRVFLNPCLLVLLSWGTVAMGEDFTLSDGTVLRGAKVVEVRPDALVVSHAKGVAMAEMEKLPRAVRVRYGYDARKAAAYRARQTSARRTKDEENRRLLTAHEERKREMARAEWEARTAPGAVSGNTGEIRFTPRVNASERAFAAGVAGIGGEIAQAEEARLAADAPVTFWTSSFWNNPVMKALGAVLGGAGGGGKGNGFNSEPRNWR